MVPFSPNVFADVSKTFYELQSNQWTGPQIWIWIVTVNDRSAGHAPIIVSPVKWFFQPGNSSAIFATTLKDFNFAVVFWGDP